MQLFTYFYYILLFSVGRVWCLADESAALESRDGNANCVTTFNGQFEISVEPSTSSPPRMLRRQTSSTCGKPGSFTLNLNNGLLQDSDGRTGYIDTDSSRFQFDEPIPSGGENPGFSVCNGNELATNKYPVFYECEVNGHYKIYVKAIIPNCERVNITVLPCDGGSTSTTTSTTISTTWSTTSSTTSSSTTISPTTSSSTTSYTTITNTTTTTTTISSSRSSLSSSAKITSQPISGTISSKHIASTGCLSTAGYSPSTTGYRYTMSSPPAPIATGSGSRLSITVLPIYFVVFAVMLWM